VKAWDPGFESPRARHNLVVAGVLEGECRRAINTIGLGPSVGFLHDLSNHRTKQSLFHDMMEPFRWPADASVIQAIESGILDIPGFYFTGDDYRYRLRIAELATKRLFLCSLSLPLSI